MSKKPKPGEETSEETINIQNSNVGVVGDHAKVEGGIHFDNSKTTFSVNADKIEGLTQAERINNVEQNFGASKKKE